MMKKKPTTILTADWHIRGDRPICRTDDYMEAQAKKLVFIQELAYEHSCPILVAGDIGHRPIWGDKLLNWAINLLEDTTDGSDIIAVAGQHDLPNHRIDKYEEAGLGVLSKALQNFEILEYDDAKRFGGVDIYPFSYSNDIKVVNNCNKINVALIHQMVIKSQKDKLWPDQQANSGKKLLRNFPCYDLIVSGDNHQSFSVKYDGRLLVNPGSIMRMTAGQIDHKPRVALWYAETNEIEWVYLPIEDNVISREHIDEVKKRDFRIEKYVERLNSDYITGFDYDFNMKKFLNVNKVEKRVVEKIKEGLNEND